MDERGSSSDVQRVLGTLIFVLASHGHAPGLLHRHAARRRERLRGQARRVLRSLSKMPSILPTAQIIENARAEGHHLGRTDAGTGLGGPRNARAIHSCPCARAV